MIDPLIGPTSGPFDVQDRLGGGGRAAFRARRSACSDRV